MKPDEFVIIKTINETRNQLDGEMCKEHPDTDVLCILYSKILALEWVLYGKHNYKPEDVVALVKK